jgi:HSP20 family molecular chaperone IbpA
MSKTRPGKENTEELREQVRQLQESLRKLQEGAKEPRGKAEGLAEGVVTALGKLVPGLGRLIETASRMPEFQQRLAAIDEEVKRKFKEQPLDRASLGIAGNVGRRQLGIPPSVRRGRPGRAASTGAGEAFCKKPLGKDGRRGKYRQSRPPFLQKVHISPETPAQLHVDVFDEGSKIVVLAEAPGLKAEDITVSLEGTVLLISVEAAHRGGLQRIELPCEVAGKPEMSLSNGILNIQIRKAGKQ